MKYTQKQIDEYRAKWLTQLRDPESKLLIGELESIDDPNKRCCLGHACHALEAERTLDFTGQEVYYSCGNDRDMAYLPLGIAEKLNITNNGKLRKPYQFTPRGFEYEDLAYLNDSGLVDSPAIMADIIEEQFKNDNFIEYHTES